MAVDLVRSEAIVGSVRAVCRGSSDLADVAIIRLLSLFSMKTRRVRSSSTPRVSVTVPLLFFFCPAVISVST